MKNLFRLKDGDIVLRLTLGLLIVCFPYRIIVGQNKDEATDQAKSIKVASAYPLRPAKNLDIANKLTDLAKTDHITLLKWSMKKYKQHVHDYQGIFYRRERVNGKLRYKEEIAIKFKEEPFSLLMNWKENPDKIDKLLYVENRRNNSKMIVHPTGLFSWIKSIERDPRCKEALRSSRSTCDEFGFYRTMAKILKVYEQADKQEDLQIRYLGETRIDDRPCIAIERRLPPRKQYLAARVVLEFDKEYILPTSITSYDWQGKLLSQYVYKNLCFNSDLKSAQFTRAANNL